MPPNFAQYCAALDIRAVAKQALRYFEIHNEDAHRIGDSEVLESYFLAVEKLEDLVEKTSKVVNKYKEAK